MRFHFSTRWRSQRCSVSSASRRRTARSSSDFRQSAMNACWCSVRIRMRRCEAGSSQPIIATASSAEQHKKTIFNRMGTSNSQSSTRAEPPSRTRHDYGRATGQPVRAELLFRRPPPSGACLPLACIGEGPPNIDSAKHGRRILRAKRTAVAEGTALRGRAAANDLGGLPPPTRYNEDICDTKDINYRSYLAQ